MNADAAVYLDSSALVKLVVREAESAALAGHLADHPNRVSCALVRVEVPLAVRSHGRAAMDRARALLKTISLLRLDDSLLDAAAALGADGLRSLDAIHLAGATALGQGLTELITYDRRMTDAARDLGLVVAAPA
jgi:predicted nucleic acid-binding protein